VIEFAFRELELYAVKAARTVLRGLGGSNAAWLPDVVVKGVHFLARLGVIAFFCNYRDKKCTPGAIHHSLRGKVKI
jgi:hypothetical protein